MRWNHILSFSSVLLLLSAPKVRSLGGVFELRLRSFTNPMGTDGEGLCCNSGSSSSNSVNSVQSYNSNSNRTTLPSFLSSESSSNPSDSLSEGKSTSEVLNHFNSCKGQCSTKFRVCVKHYQVTIDPTPPCFIGEAMTESIHSNNVSASNSKNNTNFHFEFKFRWPGTFSLIIEAWHHDQNASQRLITRMAIQQYLDIGEEWRAREWTGGNSGQVSLQYDYRVRCLPEYYRGSCDKYCRSRDDKFGHYTCSDQGDIICLPGWTGTYCEKAVCLLGCHETHGFCKEPNQCECHPGWEGTHCSDCKRYPGCKHGRCTKQWECECEEGWGGLFCNQDLNYCTNHKPCWNGGTCFNTGQGSYTCSCPAGYAGADCEVKVEGQCQCVNGGTCRENRTASFCQCPEGWSGAHCETLTVTCTDSPCLNGGTCLDATAHLTCACPPGFGGLFCETAITSGSDSVCKCQNGGVCNSITGRCKCPPGYTDEKCSTSSDNCAAVNCQNGGTCIPLPGSLYRCQCVLGWTGEMCTVPVNICATLPCANGGTCHTMPKNNYLCDCAHTFGGKDCSEMCACENGGICRGEECICPPNFTGTRCQYSNTTYTTLELQDKGTVGTVLNPSDGDEESLSPEHVVLVVCVSVATPLLVVLAVAVVLVLKKRKRQEQRRNDELARIQNEQNTVQCLTKKCIDPHMIVNTLDIPKAKCSNLDLSFNKGLGYPSKTSTSCLSSSDSKSDLLHPCADRGGGGGCGGGGGGGGLLITSVDPCWPPQHHLYHSSSNHHSPNSQMSTPQQQSPVIHHPGDDQISILKDSNNHLATEV